MGSLIVTDGLGCDDIHAHRNVPMKSILPPPRPRPTCVVWSLPIALFVYQARGFLLGADNKEVEDEVFRAPSKLATESYQSLFDQVCLLS